MPIDRRPRLQGREAGDKIGSNLMALAYVIGAATGGMDNTAVVNPDYGKTPGEVDFNYKGDPSQLVKQPYIGKQGWMSKMQGDTSLANQYNNELAFKTILGNTEFERNKALAELGKRLQVEAEQEITPTRVKAENQKEQFRTDEGIRGTAAKQPINVLSAQGIPYNAQNMQQFQESIVPTIMSRANAANKFDTSQFQVGTQRNMNQFNLDQALMPTENAYQMNEATAKVDRQPLVQAAEKMRLQMLPYMINAEALKAPVIPLAPDQQGLYNMQTGSFMYKPLSPLERLQQIQQMGFEPAPVSAGVPAADDASQQDTIIIGGEKFRRIKR